MRTLAVLVMMAMVVLGVAPGAVRAADPPETTLTIENNRFSPEELKVKANTPFVIVVTNKDKTPEEFESKDLKIEKVVPPGQTVKIRVRALKPGTYGFFGDFHQQTAKGRIVAE
jgi:plastocyanin domain-containing protein